jgi:uncharacterized protein involved in exopolysaccharide biosynthesis
MHQLSQEAISLRDGLRILFRHKAKAALVFGCVMGLSIAGAALWPRTYESETKLFIRIGRSSVSLDPTATVGQTLSLSESREREINSVLEILRSRELLERVVDEMGASVVLGRSATDGPRDAESRAREKAVLTLDKSISCGVTKNSDVISVRCKARRPELAQRVLIIFVRAFKDHHLRLNRTSGSYEFFVAQAEKANAKLEEKKLQLRDAKNRVGIGSVESQAKMVEQQVASLEETLASTRASIAAKEAKLASLRDQYPDLDRVATLDASRGSSASAVDNMRAELYRLQIRERELLAKLSASHPQVIAVKEQAKQARRLLAHQEYLTEWTLSLTLKARVGDLQRSLAEARRRLLRLNEDEVRIRELEQDVATLTANRNKYIENREQARIDSELETGRISNVNVAQAPTFVSKPVSPKMATVLLLGFLAAVFASLSLTLISEYFDDSFQTPEQVERVLDLPVVMTVPESRRNTRTWCRGERE